MARRRAVRRRGRAAWPAAFVAVSALVRRPSIEVRRSECAAEVAAVGPASEAAAPGLADGRWVACCRRGALGAAWACPGDMPDADSGAGVSVAAAGASSARLADGGRRAGGRPDAPAGAEVAGSERAGLTPVHFGAGVGPSTPDSAVRPGVCTSSCFLLGVSFAESTRRRRPRPPRRGSWRSTASRTRRATRSPHDIRGSRCDSRPFNCRSPRSHSSSMLTFSVYRQLATVRKVSRGCAVPGPAAAAIRPAT